MEENRGKKKSKKENKRQSVEKGRITREKRSKNGKFLREKRSKNGKFLREKRSKNGKLREVWFDKKIKKKFSNKIPKHIK